MSILFLSDIDGTLVTGGRIASEAEEALRRFVGCGNYFSLATGRHGFGIQRLLDQLPVNAPCVILTGAAVYDPIAKTLLNAKPLPENTGVLLERLFEAYPEMGIQVFTDIGLCNLRLNPFLQKHGIPEEIACGTSGFEALEGKRILKVGLCCEDKSRIEPAINQFFADKQQYNWHFSFVIAAEVFSPAASKGLAIQTLIDSLPEKPDCIAVAGDSPNDLSMFQYADITFAPETAFPEVRDAADFIIPPPDRGGVAQALNMLLHNPSVMKNKAQQSI
jgi:Cof subfamily protein (haloacid dehalogenase superfamily)